GRTGGKGLGAWGLGLAGPARYPPRAETLQLRAECNKARKSGSISRGRPVMQAVGGVGGGPGTQHLYSRLVTKRPPFGCLLEIVETLALTLLIFFVIQNFVAQPYKVQQRSMEHTLEPEQYVLVDKITPRVDPYDRGDIVVFNPPTTWAQADGTPFIKRVIGEGGDTIKIQDGKVFVNGTAISEAYVYADVPG